MIYNSFSIRNTFQEDLNKDEHMKIFSIEINDIKDLYNIISKIGADPRSLPFFGAKDRIRHLYIRDMDPRAANALKQELLSRGGDLIVSRHTIDCTVKTTDALIMATDKQISDLLKKLDFMPYWGLDSIQTELAERFRILRRKRWKMELGRSRTPLVLDSYTRIMGIINVTPDSFFPGSRTSQEYLVSKASGMLDDGARVLDIGAESTRPGAPPVDQDEEISRLVPAIKTLRSNFPDACISADTYKAGTAEQALAAGADIINDISGLSYSHDLASAVAEYNAILVIGHIRGTPLTMQESPFYNDPIAEITEELEKSIEIALGQKVSEDRIIVDPGIGFGKRQYDNLSILKHINSFKSLGFPLLVGHSRKGFIGKITSEKDSEERLDGTLAVSSLCALKEIEMIRVHDVLQNRNAIKVLNAIKEVQS